MRLKKTALKMQCDAPEVLSVPVITRSRVGNIPVDEIDAVFSASVAAVEEMKTLGAALAMPLLQYALSVYALDVEKLIDLRPDVILTCFQTSHSAVLETNLLEDALVAVLGYVPRVVHCDGTDLEGIWSDMQRIAEALGISEQGKKFIDEKKKQMQNIAETSRGRKRHRVVCIQWPAPIMAASAWVPQMLEMMGASDVSGKKEEAVILEPNDVLDLSPDIIIFALCGIGLGTSTTSAEKLMRRIVKGGAKGKQSLPKRVAVVDGMHVLSRPGPWLISSLETISEIIHPEAQKYGHEGVLWKWLPQYSA